MQHPDEGTIHSWLDGALAPDEAARVEAHVAECPECAAAVAEARGFIAASSRILTKLDDVPSGVVPAARPLQRRNVAAWRAAAAVLVVAVGSLVVLNRTGGSKATSVSSQRAMSEAAPAAAAPSDTRVADTMAPQAAVSQSKASVPPFVAKAMPGPQRVAEARQAPASAPSRDESRQDRASAGYVAEGGQANAATAVAADAVAEHPLRVVREEKVDGGKQTLYAVAPGDTVTLFEPQPPELQGVATTGVAATGAAVPSARRAISPQVVNELSAKAPAVAVDSSPIMGRIGGATAQSANAKSAAVAPALPAPPPPRPLRTISWMDTTSGRVLRLSGRLPVDQLEEIRRKIDRERAAAATRKPSR